jgi:hypothetical protein
VQHNLKIDTKWLAAVEGGQKKAEIRRADREFRVGDELLLYLHDKSRAVSAQVTDILPLSEVPGCMCVDFVCLSVTVKRVIDGRAVVEQELALGSFG